MMKNYKLSFECNLLAQPLTSEMCARIHNFLSIQITELSREI